MEIIQQILADSLASGFWNFVGYWILITTIIGIPAQLIVFLINRPLRHMNIRKHGYPPIHCDADGDFKKDEQK